MKLYAQKRCKMNGKKLFYNNECDIQNCENYKDKLRSYIMKSWKKKVIEWRLRKKTQVTNNHFNFMLGRSTIEVINLLRRDMDRRSTKRVKNVFDT